MLLAPAPCRRRGRAASVTSMAPEPASDLSQVTRRELLVAGAATSAALLLAGLRRLRRRCGAGARMRKGISLIGDVNRYDDALGVRPYLLDGPHPATFLSLWVSLADRAAAGARTRSRARRRSAT